MSTPAAPQDLRPTLDAIGNAATVAADLVSGLDEQALRAAAPGTPSCSDILQQLVDAGTQLGNVAHDVLGHVPGAAAAYTQHPERPNGEQLLQKLSYLRAHIVSTVDQQGVAVWSTPTAAGRPLFAYAVDLKENDVALIDALRRAAARVR